MELSEIRNLLEGYSEKINGFRDSLDLDRLEEEIEIGRASCRERV